MGECFKIIATETNDMYNYISVQFEYFFTVLY